MTRANMPSLKTWPFIPLLAAGLLLSPRPAAAQMIVGGPATPAARTLTAWFQQHIPAKFQAHGLFEVQPFSDAGMEAYLHDSDSASENNADNNSEDDGEIDGVFVNDPPQIVLRVPVSGQIDFSTFAHEYGHYVWFDLLTKDDRKRYKALYDKQKSARRLVTDYAAESVEEGFAEAFSYDITDPASLRRQDSLSYQFLSRWPAAAPLP